VNTNVSEEYATLVFRVEVIGVKMQPGYIEDDKECYITVVVYHGFIFTLITLTQILFTSVLILDNGSFCLFRSVK
jgi:hypothetical protein